MLLAIISALGYHIIDDFQRSEISATKSFDVCCIFDYRIPNYHIFAKNSNHSTVYIDPSIEGYDTIFESVYAHHFIILSNIGESKYFFGNFIPPRCGYSLFNDTGRIFDFLSNITMKRIIISHFGCLDAILQCHTSHVNNIHYFHYFFAMIIFMCFFLLLYLKIMQIVSLSNMIPSKVGFFNESKGKFYGDNDLVNKKNITFDKAEVIQLRRYQFSFEFDSFSQHNLKNGIIFIHSYKQSFPDCSEINVEATFLAEGIEITKEPLIKLKNLRHYKPVEIIIPLKTCSHYQILISDSLITSFLIGSQFTSFTHSLFDEIGKFYSSNNMPMSGNIQKILDLFGPQFGFERVIVAHQEIGKVGEYHSPYLSQISEGELKYIFELFPSSNFENVSLSKANFCYHKTISCYDNLLFHVLFGYDKKNEYDTSVLDIFAIASCIVHRLSYFKEKSLELANLLDIFSMNDSYGFWQYSMNGKGELVLANDFTHSNFSNVEKFLVRKDIPKKLYDRIVRIGTGKSDLMFENNIGDQIVCLVSSINPLSQERSVFCFCENIQSFLNAENKFIQEIKEKEEAISILKIIPYAQLKRISSLKPDDFTSTFSGTYHCRRYLDSKNRFGFENYQKLDEPESDGIDIDGNIRFILLDHHNFSSLKQTSPVTATIPPKKRNSVLYSSNILRPNASPKTLIPDNSSTNFSHNNEINDKNQCNTSGLHCIFSNAINNSPLSFPYGPNGVIHFTSSMDLNEMWQIGFNGFIIDASDFGNHVDYISPLLERELPNGSPIIAWNVDTVTQKVTNEKDFDTQWDVLCVSRSMPFSQFHMFLKDESRDLFLVEYEKVLNRSEYNMLIDVQVLKLDGNYDWYSLNIFKTSKTSVKCLMVFIDHVHKNAAYRKKHTETIDRILKHGRMGVWYFTDDDEDLPYPISFETGFEKIFHINWSFVWKLVTKENREEFTQKIRNSFDFRHSFELRCNLQFEGTIEQVVMRGKPQINGNDLSVVGMCMQVESGQDDEHIRDDIEKLRNQLEECERVIDTGKLLTQ